ncbi:MAG: TPM domain-containing protein [Lachnospiraceae bacterium]|jgi:uncharacterized protein
MKKKVLSIAALLLFCMNFSLTVFAADDSGFAGEYERLMDRADILSDDEEEKLLEKLDEVSERQKFEVSIVVFDTMDGGTASEYADDIYDECNFGYGPDKDGILLFLSMEERDWWISTSGYGITAFTDVGLDYLSEQFVSALSDGAYADGFDIFIEQCDDFLTQARSGEPYNKKNLPRDPLGLYWIVIALAVGIALSKILVGNMKGKLKTVRNQAAAHNYVKEDSMRITESRDLFLYRKVDRTVKVKKTSSGSSTHVSSSGKTHGGKGGKF